MGVTGICPDRFCGFSQNPVLAFACSAQLSHTQLQAVRFSSFFLPYCFIPTILSTLTSVFTVELPASPCLPAYHSEHYRTQFLFCFVTLAFLPHLPTLPHRPWSYGHQQVFFRAWERPGLKQSWTKGRPILQCSRTRQSCKYSHTQ